MKNLEKRNWESQYRLFFDIPDSVDVDENHYKNAQRDCTSFCFFTLREELRNLFIEIYFVFEPILKDMAKMLRRLF